MKKTLIIVATALGAYGLYCMWNKKNEKKSDAPKGTSLLADKQPINQEWPERKALIPNEVLDEFSTKYTDLFPTPGKAIETPGALTTDGIDTKVAQQIVEM